MTDQSQTREPGLRTVTVSVNETRYAREVEPRQLLVYFVRDQLGLTGTQWAVTRHSVARARFCSTAPP